MQVICVLGDGLNKRGPLKRLLSFQNPSLPIDVGLQRSSLHHIAHGRRECRLQSNPV